MDRARDGLGRRREPGQFFTIMALIGLGLCGYAPSVEAALAPDAPIVLAHVVLLSDAAMAKQTGAGLQAAPVTRGPVGHSSVILWDEFKPAQPANPQGNTTISVTIGLPGK